jgi:hypothetical protein
MQRGSRVQPFWTLKFWLGIDGVADFGLEGMVSKKLDAPYRSGPSKAWIKVKNPKAPAATRVIDGTF